MTDRKYKILIIDDDAFILNMYVSKFEKAGHSIETARSGVETIGKLKDGYQPEIALIDVVLPDMNGLDLLEKIKSDKLASETICIMFTNQNSTEETDRAKSLNVAGYVVKANLIPSEVVSIVMGIAENYKK